MKTAQLQIRLTPEQKAYLKRRASAAGQDLSSYVLSRVAPVVGVRVVRVLENLLASDGGSHDFAALHDLLTGMSASEFADAWAVELPPRLSPRAQNLVAAMVEERASQLGVAAPAWAADVEPLAAPWFATDLPSLRAHLLRASPTCYRRRNLFVDASVGDRV